MNVLVQLAAALAVALLRYVVERRDLMEKGQAVEYEAALQRAQVALDWKARAAASPDGGAGLGVRPGAQDITLPSHNPPTPSQPNLPGV